MLSRLTFEHRIDGLEFSCRTSNVLKKLNIKTVRDLVGWNEVQLLKERNFGRKSLNEIKEVLAWHGFALGMKPPAPPNFEDLIAKVNELSDTVFLLEMKLKNNMVSYEKLAKLHNEMALSVANMESKEIVTPLRDQFAMAALPALIQNKGIQTTDVAAEYAYAMADAMMEEREAK